MSQNRRDFLKLTSAGLTACGLNMPAFLSRAAALAPASNKPGGKDTILVVVEFTGGNDGLNMVVPYNDDNYKKARPTLAISGSQVKKINDQIGLHPGMDGLAELLQDNALCVVQGVGYPNPDPVAFSLHGHLADGRAGRHSHGRMDRQGAQEHAAVAVVPPQDQQREVAVGDGRRSGACRPSPLSKSSNCRPRPPMVPIRRINAT